MELSVKQKQTLLQREGCILLVVTLTILGKRMTLILCLLILEIILI